MGHVTIRTNQAVLGWPRGHVETVERTSLIDGLIENGTVSLFDGGGREHPVETLVNFGGEVVAETVGLDKDADEDDEDDEPDEPDEQPAAKRRR